LKTEFNTERCSGLERKKKGKEQERAGQREKRKEARGKYPAKAFNTLMGGKSGPKNKIKSRQ